MQLSPEVLDLLDQLAAPIAFNQREQFLRAVADALAGVPEPGPGVIHRVARGIQGRFIVEAQREHRSTGIRHDGMRLP